MMDLTINLDIVRNSARPTGPAIREYSIEDIDTRETWFGLYTNMTITLEDGRFYCEINDDERKRARCQPDIDSWDAVERNLANIFREHCDRFKPGDYRLHVYGVAMKEFTVKAVRDE